MGLKRLRACIEILSSSYYKSYNKNKIRNTSNVCQFTPKSLALKVFQKNYFKKRDKRTRFCHNHKVFVSIVFCQTNCKMLGITAMSLTANKSFGNSSRLDSFMTWVCRELSKHSLSVLAIL